MKTLPKFDIEALKTYDHALYQKSYPHWKLSCYSTDDGFPVTPSMVQAVIAEAHDLEVFAIILLCYAIAMSILSGINGLVAFLQSRGGMDKNTRNKCTIIRFILTLLLCVGSLVCLLKMFLVADTDVVTYLSIHECSNDKILNEAFVQMNDYYNTLKFKNWITIFFIGCIIAIDILVYLFYLWEGFRKRRQQRMQRLGEHLLGKHKP